MSDHTNYKCPKCGEPLDLDIPGNNYVCRCGFVENVEKFLEGNPEQIVKNHERYGGKTMPSKRGICVDCKQERALVAADRCSTCYKKSRGKGKKAPAAAKQKVKTVGIFKDGGPMKNKGEVVPPDLVQFVSNGETAVIRVSFDVVVDVKNLRVEQQ